MRSQDAMLRQIKTFEKKMQRRFNPLVRLHVTYGQQNYRPEIVENFKSMTLLVCDVCGIDIEDLKYETRGSIEVSDCRMVAMYYCYKKIERNFSAIGKFFNRHHSSVIYAVNTIPGRLEVKDFAITTIVDELEKRLSQLQGCKIKPNENKV